MIQLPADDRKKQQKVAQVLRPLHPNLNEAPGFILAVVGIWEVNK